MIFINLFKSDTWDMESHYCFTLHFFNYEQSWASFHMSLLNLYFLYCKQPISIHSQFYYFVVHHFAYWYIGVSCKLKKLPSIICIAIVFPVWFLDFVHFCTATYFNFLYFNFYIVKCMAFGFYALVIKVYQTSRL